MRQQWLVLTAALAISFSGAAETTGVAGPFLGHVYDSGSQALYPIHGIPGAARAGAAFAVCPDLQFAVVSPEQDYAIALCGAERNPYLVRFGGTPSVERVADAAAADGVVLSPRGRAAVFYRTAEQTIDIFTGLPNRPSLRTINVRDGLRTLAVSDDGALVYAASAEGDLLVIDGQGPRSAGVSGNVSAVRFRPGTHEAAILVGTDVLLLSGAGTQIVSSPSEQPHAIEFSRDASRLFVTTSREILALSATGEPVASAVAPCRMTSLVRLNPESILHTTCEADPTLRIVEFRDDRFRVLFVPRLPD